MARTDRLTPELLNTLPSPCFIIDIEALETNAQLLQHVQHESGAKILLALKGFAAWSTFPMLAKYLAGTTASGIHEAQLGHDYFKPPQMPQPPQSPKIPETPEKTGITAKNSAAEVHTYAPAFRDDEIDAVAAMSDHISFNSVSQWQRFYDRVQNCQCAIRVNPQHREVETELYDPAAPCSRLGATELSLESFQNPPGLTGLHFHTLCECDFDALERTASAFVDRFGHLLPHTKWVNFGGGHHITRPGYDVDGLIAFLKKFAHQHDVQIYLEPGEAVALNAGYLMTTVLDFVRNDIDIAILDTSATAHMPDVLEMPYRPKIIAPPTHSPSHPTPHPTEPTGKHTYRLGGLTCLAGDVIGDYTFNAPLKIGDQLLFTDMAHYSMVKTTTFNGINLPAIVHHDPRIASPAGTNVIRQFDYDDYKNRLS